MEKWSIGVSEYRALSELYRRSEGFGRPCRAHPQLTILPRAEPWAILFSHFAAAAFPPSPSSPYRPIAVSPFRPFALSL